MNNKNSNDNNYNNYNNLNINENNREYISFSILDNKGKKIETYGYYDNSNDESIDMRVQQLKEKIQKSVK